MKIAQPITPNKFPHFEDFAKESHVTLGDMIDVTSKVASAISKMSGVTFGATETPTKEAVEKLSSSEWAPGYVSNETLYTLFATAGVMLASDMIKDREVVSISAATTFNLLKKTLPKKEGEYKKRISDGNGPSTTEVIEEVTRVVLFANEGDMEKYLNIVFATVVSVTAVVTAGTTQIFEKELGGKK